MAQIPSTASLRPGQCGKDSNSLVQVHDLKLACKKVAAGSCRTLGYHVPRRDKSLTICAREAFAAPLRELDKVIDEVALKDFQPDLTNSGLIASLATASSRTSKTKKTTSSPMMISWSPGPLVCWSPGLLVPWSPGLSVPWLVSRSAGLVVCWSCAPPTRGLLVLWRPFTGPAGLLSLLTL